MSTFHLQIVTPGGLFFDGQAQKLIARTIEGDVGILSGHSDYVTALAGGNASVTDGDGNIRQAMCGGGILSVKKGITRIVADNFEWDSNGH